MKLQKKIVSASVSSSPTFSTRSTSFPSLIHSSADESDQDSFQLVKSKKTEKKRGSAPRSDISKKKVPCSQAPPETRKPKVPSIVINDKLKTTPLLKTLETLYEKRIMGKMINGKRLKFSLKCMKTTGTFRDISPRSI
ncbi:hypothetical protein AVEN_121612-1 [Araneus ventricosus]|uniref:Uncharacterized protein n=1 Tax=Araneus ventricosus TaxID=182803 RepID=A0A4Y2DVF4_ARAVE|nr:hypothetical protein AVEN_121612-1 [Araneus ventricosus]